VTCAIVGAADERDAAVVVTGTRGRSPLTATLLGSTAEGILRHAGRPVLLVPPAQAAR
jgi:nucleotide-binding universal stress UspA family protein